MKIDTEAEEVAGAEINTGVGGLKNRVCIISRRLS